MNLEDVYAGIPTSGTGYHGRMSGRSLPAGRPRGTALLIALWGAGGVAALLASAVWRLTPLALEPFASGAPDALVLGLYAASIVFTGYFEGYRAFQLAFAPRVVARALHLAENPRPLHVILAPAYCMGLVHATRRRLLTSWILLVSMMGLVVLVKLTPQPWRGVIDAGVVLALAWGVVVIGWYLVRGIAGRPPPGAADMPDAGGVDESPAAEAA